MCRKLSTSPSQMSLVTFLVTLVAMTGLWLLTGCTSPREVPCPVLMTYSAADNQALLAELNGNKTPHPQTNRYLRDYAGLRAQARICSGNN